MGGPSKLLVQFDRDYKLHQVFQMSTDILKCSEKDINIRISDGCKENIIFMALAK